jgi:hypothetical protein
MRFPAGAKIYLLCSVHPGCGINLISHPVGNSEYSSRSKAPGLKADELFTSSA